MALIDDVYRSLMAAGHRPNEIAHYEITDIGLMIHEAEDSESAVEKAARAVLQGEKVQPLGVELNSDSPMAAAVRAAREARKREQAD